MNKGEVVELKTVNPNCENNKKGVITRITTGHYWVSFKNNHVVRVKRY